ncbi:MAG: GAF domain-containing protein [Bacteroidetes bacterium]|nr:GAF domain-containing protein [Bacteroidota bacterium]
MPELFNIVEHLSKSRKIRDGKFNEAIFEIISTASAAIKTQRVNAWIFVNNFSEIKCIGNYDLLNPSLELSPNLTQKDLPNYFKLLTSREIVITNDTFKNKQAAELLDIYLKPLDVHSLMDIPIHIGGELVGLVCFENTKTARNWTEREQKFGLVIAQMISLAIETDAKQKAKLELEKALTEQKILLQEVNHRVKNNLAIISSLINMQSEKAQDEYHKFLFQETRNRLMSIAAVHELLYQSKSYSQVNFKKYLNLILDNLIDSIDIKNKEIEIEREIKDVTLNVSIAIPLALIINELVTNSFKHAFKKKKSGTIKLSLVEKGEFVKLIVADNGPGFDHKKIKTNSVGFEIIDSLIEQINATISHKNENGSFYEITFKK